MTDPFDAAVAFVLLQEGEGPNDPRDPGQLTRWGVSARAHPDVDVEHLTRDDAIAIYRTRYWALCRCEDFPPPLALALFDGAVQHGPLQAIKLLQDALGVTRDGVIGPRTLGAAHALAWGDVLVRFLAYRLRLYAGLPHASIFGLGWARRILSVQRAIYEMQGGAV